MIACDTYLFRKQNLPCSEPRTYIWKETILWDGRGSEIADYLTDCELRRCVEPNELLGEVQGLLNREKLGSDNDWNKEQLSLLTEVLETVQDDSESEHEPQLSY
mgnify:CR=1 FL=1